MNNSSSVGGTFCELEKASYCVNRGIVVDKLEFSGKFQTLIQSYLIGRYQKVLIGTINAYDDSSRCKFCYKLGFLGFDLGFIISSYLF